MTNSRLYGKTIVAIGDSLFHGNKDCQLSTWLEMVAKRNEMKLYNYGQNGNTIAVQHKEQQPLPPCASAMPIWLTALTTSSFSAALTTSV